MTLSFDPKTHTYTQDGKVLPSVTQIINRVLPRKWNADEWAMQRGTMVHKAMHLYLNGGLNFDKLDERIKGRVESLIKAVDQFGWRPRITEESFKHSVMCYAGTPDMITECGCIVDWKASIEWTVQAQLGGYVGLCRANDIKANRVYACKCNDNGEYKIEAFGPDESFMYWCSIYTIYGYMLKNKIGEV